MKCLTCTNSATRNKYLNRIAQSVRTEGTMTFSFQYGSDRVGCLVLHAQEHQKAAILLESQPSGCHIALEGSPVLCWSFPVAPNCCLVICFRLLPSAFQVRGNWSLIVSEAHSAAPSAECTNPSHHDSGEQIYSYS